MPLTRRQVEREVRDSLGLDDESRQLLRQGSFAGVRRVTQAIHACIEKLNTEAGLSGHQAAVVTNTVLQSSLPSLLLLRDGDLRGAATAVSNLWIALSTGERAEPLGLPQAVLAKRGDERELEDVIQMFPAAVFEETAAARRNASGREILRRLMTYLELSFDDVGRMVGVSGETVRRWERGVSRVPAEALAALAPTESALTRLLELFLPQRLAEVVRRKADLFAGIRALDWILQGRIAEVADRYEQALSYQA
jgi:transcriptional regulator with XRE-family HTH domain